MSAKFTPPKSVQAVYKRCDKPLNDNKGLFKAYLQGVNDDRELDNVESDVKHVTKALRFDVTTSSSVVAVGPFLIRW